MCCGFVSIGQYKRINLIKEIGNEMKYSIINISCGLGNQFFQYAFGYAQHRRNNSKLVLYKYEDQPSHRPYQIGNYAIEYSGLISYDSMSLKDRVILKASKNIPDREFEYDKSILKQKQMFAFYNGYWQNWRYFDEYYDSLIKLFTYNQMCSEQCNRYIDMVINSQNSLAVHIRRGDYATTNMCIGIEYYKQALNQARNILRDFKLFVFSDDKKYIKENYSFLGEYVLIDGVSDVEEFEIMRTCEHHIIANSTFSWWSAYLGRKREGLVIAPVVYHWMRDFYLPKWICLNAKIENKYE